MTIVISQLYLIGFNAIYVWRRNLNLPTDYHVYLCSNHIACRYYILVLCIILQNSIDIMQCLFHFSEYEIVQTKRISSCFDLNMIETIALFVINKKNGLCFDFVVQIPCQNAVEQINASERARSCLHHNSNEWFKLNSSCQ